MTVDDRTGLDVGHSQESFDDWDEVEIGNEVLKIFDGLESLPETVRQRVKKEKERISSKRRALSEKMETAPFIKLKDKIAFTLGVLNVALTCFIVGAVPEYFYLWHTPKAVILIITRLYLYRKQRFHYFLLDFCYYANLLLQLYLWVYPQSTYLFNVCFAFSMGPLLWAIILWRNSLVFHSLDKLTSIFIHISPALTMWGIRWFSSVRTPSAFAFAQDTSLWAFTVDVIPPYILWQVLYALKVWFVSREKVKDKNYTTSFSYLMNDEKNIVNKLITSSDSIPPKLMFVLFQFFYTIVTMAPVYIWYHSFIGNTVFIIVMFLGCSWNGANFYVEVFARRYQQSIEYAKRVRRLTTSNGSTYDTDMESSKNKNE